MGNTNKKYNIKVSKNVDVLTAGQLGSEQPAIHDGAIISAISIDCNQIATCGDDKRIAIIKSDTFSSARNSQLYPRFLLGHDKAVNRLALCSRNQTLWSCSRDLSIRQWNIGSGKCTQVIESAHTLNISAIAVSNGEEPTIFTGSRDYSVKGWDINTGKCQFDRHEPRNIVTCLSCHPSDPNLLLQGSEDLCVRIWDIRDSSVHPASKLSGYVYFPLCLDAHDGGMFLATGSKGFDGIGCEVKIWDMRNAAATMAELRGHSQDVTCCSFVRSGDQKQLVLSTSKDGCVIAWDWNALPGATSSTTTSGRSVYSLGRALSSLAVTSTGTFPTLSAGCSDGSLHVLALDAQNMTIRPVLSTAEYRTP